MVVTPKTLRLQNLSYFIYIYLFAANTNEFVWDFWFTRTSSYYFSIFAFYARIAVIWHKFIIGVCTMRMTWFTLVTKQAAEIKVEIKVFKEKMADIDSIGRDGVCWRRSLWRLANGHFRKPLQFWPQEVRLILYWTLHTLISCIGETNERPQPHGGITYKQWSFPYFQNITSGGIRKKGTNGFFFLTKKNTPLTCVALSTIHNGPHSHHFYSFPQSTFALLIIPWTVWRTGVRQSPFNNNEEKKRSEAFLSN